MTVLLSFDDFVLEHALKNKSTANKNNQKMRSSLSLSDVKIFLRETPCEFDIEIVILHPTKGTH